MRIAAVKPDELALVLDDGYVLVGQPLSANGLLRDGGSMAELIERYTSIRPSLEQLTSRGPRVPANPSQLRAPVERPSKIWAAATNYRRGSAGIGDLRGRGEATELSRQQILEMAFLKPPSAVIGPGQDIVIPRQAETIFPELELCVVIGKTCANLSVEEALDAVFGYTVILDVTVRGYGSGKGLEGSRCVRKGFDTFAPIGPWIATRDEIPDPQNVEMRLWVNDDLRQHATTEGMINGVAELVSFLSHVGTLYPGDLIATGNPDAPDFQQALGPGDVLKAEIQGIGVLELGVRRAE